MDKILAILKENCPGIDFENQKSLVDDGVIDSFDVVAIVSDLTSEFDIDITINDIVPENFNSIEAINALVERLIDAD
ncbi:MAG: acyl carrier protein [Clostridia bacterium]|nr:acyl carrier protein [Clostridia bacterium]